MSEESYESIPEGVPLRGYVVRDLSGFLWVRDKLSTWMVNSEDVVGRSEWAGVADSHYEGAPQILYVRDGAEIHELRSARLVARNRPLALGDVNRTLQIVGGELIEELSRNMMFDIKMMDESGELKVVDAGAPDAGPPRPTWCDVSDPSGWGTIIKKDD